MSGTGKVLSNENRQKKILEPEVKIEILKNDNHFATVYGSAGDDSRPIPGDSVAYVENNNIGGKTAVGFLDTKNPPVSKDGEKRLTSRDLTGLIKTLIFLKDNGIIQITADQFEINSADDFAVSHTQLQILLSAFALAINANLTLIAASLTSLSPPTPYVPVPVTIDITAAKIDEIKLPSP